MTVVNLFEARVKKPRPSASPSRFQRPRNINDSVVSHVTAADLTDQALRGAIDSFHAALSRWIGEIRRSVNLIYVEFQLIKPGTVAYLWLETPGAAVELDISLPGACDRDGYFGGFIFMLTAEGGYVEVPDGTFADDTLAGAAHAINTFYAS